MCVDVQGLVLFLDSLKWVPLFVVVKFQLLSLHDFQVFKKKMLNFVGTHIIEIRQKLFQGVNVQDL